MARRGRPRKPGARTKGDRLIPATELVKGNDRAQAKSGLFGHEGWDVIGRAYVMGLLGEGDVAKYRCDMGRRIAALRNRLWVEKQYTCPLDTTPRGGTVHYIERDNEGEEYDWIKGELARVDAMGCGPYLDQLLDHTRTWTDSGPGWMDRLIQEAIVNRARALKKLPLLPYDPRDWMVLRAAIKGLDAIRPMQRTKTARAA